MYLLSTVREFATLLIILKTFTHLPNDGFFYTFQGISENGEWYISAVFPVRTDGLPDETDYESFDYDTFTAEHDVYFTDLTSRLNGQTAVDFTPSLIELDDFVTSLSISARSSVQDDYTVNDETIQLSRPLPGETAVAGYPFYFSGGVLDPVNDTMSIGVLIDGCTRFAAQQSFTVVGGGSWHGLVILPQLVEGDDACAVAYTGTFGEADMRLVQLPISILSPDDPATPAHCAGARERLGICSGRAGGFGGNGR